MDMLEEKKPKKSIHSPFVKRIQNLKIRRDDSKQAKDAAQNEPKGVIKPLGLWSVKKQETRKAAKKPEKPKTMIVLAFDKDKADSDALHDLLERRIIILGIRKKPANTAKWSSKKRGGKSRASTKMPIRRNKGTTRKKSSRHSLGR